MLTPRQLRLLTCSNFLAGVSIMITACNVAGWLGLVLVLGAMLNGAWTAAIGLLEAIGRRESADDRPTPPQGHRGGCLRERLR